MSPGARLGLGAVLILTSVLGMGLATRFHYTADPGDAGELRLTWRARAPLVEECRRLSPEERDALPVHMRRDEICEGRVASYRLRVWVDGEVRHSSIVHGAGARGDRPLYVFDRLRLDPGEHDVHVVFRRVGSAPGEPADRHGPVPDLLELQERLVLSAGEVALVTYDAVERRLVLKPAPRR
jgi:hypothetical protein